MAASNPVPQRQPRTLMEAHQALVCIRSGRDAPLEAWQVYYHRSAVLYAEIAEIDRGHHHEALYWAERELEKAMLVTGAMKEGQRRGTRGLNPRFSYNKKGGGCE
jgi:hypothetical protein